MRIQRQDIGNGKYQWFIDEKETNKTEAEIFELMTKQEQNKTTSQLNYFGSVDIEIRG
jgi:hypothetical protein